MISLSLIIIYYKYEECLQIRRLKMIQRVYYVKIPGREMNNMFPVLIQEIGAYISFQAAKIATEEYMELYNKKHKYIIESSEMDDTLIGEDVLFMRFHQGYDYNRNTNTILKVTSYIGVYSNLETLKNTKLYRDSLDELDMEDPRNVIRLPDGSIGYRDSVYINDLFSDGDYSESKFALHIEKLRLYRGEDREGIRRHILSIIEGDNN